MPGLRSGPSAPEEVISPCATSAECCPSHGSVTEFNSFTQDPPSSTSEALPADGTRDHAPPAHAAAQVKQPREGASAVLGSMAEGNPERTPWLSSSSSVLPAALPVHRRPPNTSSGSCSSISSLVPGFSSAILEGMGPVQVFSVKRSTTTTRGTFTAHSSSSGTFATLSAASIAHSSPALAGEVSSWAQFEVVTGERACSGDACANDSRTKSTQHLDSGGACSGAQRHQVLMHELGNLLDAQEAIFVKLRDKLFTIRLQRPPQWVTAPPDEPMAVAAAHGDTPPCTMPPEHCAVVCGENLADSVGGAVSDQLLFEPPEWIHGPPVQKRFSGSGDIPTHSFTQCPLSRSSTTSNFHLDGLHSSSLRLTEVVIPSFLHPRSASPPIYITAMRTSEDGRRKRISPPEAVTSHVRQKLVRLELRRRHLLMSIDPKVAASHLSPPAKAGARQQTTFSTVERRLTSPNEGARARSSDSLYEQTSAFLSVSVSPLTPPLSVLSVPCNSCPSFDAAETFSAPAPDNAPAGALSQFVGDDPATEFSVSPRPVSEHVLLYTPRGTERGLTDRTASASDFKLSGAGFNVVPHESRVTGRRAFVSELRPSKINIAECDLPHPGVEDMDAGLVIHESGTGTYIQFDETPSRQWAGFDLPRLASHSSTSPCSCNEHFPLPVDCISHAGSVNAGSESSMVFHECESSGATPPLALDTAGQSTWNLDAEGLDGEPNAGLLVPGRPSDEPHAAPAVTSPRLPDDDSGAAQLRRDDNTVRFQQMSGPPPLSRPPIRQLSYSSSPPLFCPPSACDARRSWDDDASCHSCHSSQRHGRTGARFHELKFFNFPACDDCDSARRGTSRDGDGGEIDSWSRDEVMKPWGMPMLSFEPIDEWHKKDFGGSGIGTRASSHWHNAGGDDSTLHDSREPYGYGSPFYSGRRLSRSVALGVGGNADSSERSLHSSRTWTSSSEVVCGYDTDEGGDSRYFAYSGSDRQGCGAFGRLGRGEAFTRLHGRTANEEITLITDPAAIAAALAGTQASHLELPSTTAAASNAEPLECPPATGCVRPTRTPEISATCRGPEEVLGGIEPDTQNRADTTGSVPESVVARGCSTTPWQAPFTASGEGGMRRTPTSTEGSAAVHPLKSARPKKVSCRLLRSRRGSQGVMRRGKKYQGGSPSPRFDDCFGRTDAHVVLHNGSLRSAAADCPVVVSGHKPLSVRTDGRGSSSRRGTGGMGADDSPGSLLPRVRVTRRGPPKRCVVTRRLQGTSSRCDGLVNLRSPQRSNTAESTLKLPAGQPPTQPATPCGVPLEERTPCRRDAAQGDGAAKDSPGDDASPAFVPFSTTTSELQRHTPVCTETGSASDARSSTDERLRYNGTGNAYSIQREGALFPSPGVGTSAQDVSAPRQSGSLTSPVHLPGVPHELLDAVPPTVTLSPPTKPLCATSVGGPQGGSNVAPQLLGTKAPVTLVSHSNGDEKLLTRQAITPLPSVLERHWAAVGTYPSRHEVAGAMPPPRTFLSTTVALSKKAAGGKSGGAHRRTRQVASCESATLSPMRRSAVASTMRNSACSTDLGASHGARSGKCSIDQARRAAGPTGVAKGTRRHVPATTGHDSGPPRHGVVARKKGGPSAVAPTLRLTSDMTATAPPPHHSLLHMKPAALRATVLKLTGPK